MQTHQILTYSCLGFFASFHGTIASRECGIKVESDPSKADYFWSATFGGALATCIGEGDVSKFLPYILGIIIGGVAGAVVFDVNSYYEPSRPQL